jgi:hypothetical protein
MSSTPDIASLVQRMSRLTDLLDKYINGGDDVNDQVLFERSRWCVL